MEATSAEDGVTAAIARWNARADEQHRSEVCVLLDDACCVRAWQSLRSSNPALVASVELLYGDDFWRTIPLALRALLAVAVLRSPASEEEQAAAAERGLQRAEQDLEVEKARVIRAARASGTRR